MRILSILALALFSTAAYATPQAGDAAAYNATIQVNGQQMLADLTVELTSFNVRDGKFLERQTLTFSGQAPQVSEEWKAYDEYLNDATIDGLLANCAANNGVLETIAVPAGTFNTCKIAFNNDQTQGYIWVAKVPFGFAQMITQRKADGLVINLALRAYR